jgi:hypothetical protein
MKHKFTLLYLLLLSFISAGAQNVTGIWKGYFVQNTFGYFQDRYKFEVQIAQLDNNAINGVTYSYKTTVFYGKATLGGFYTPGTKVLTVIETKLVEVKIEGESQPCLMTCYLEYNKMGDLETLTGTYTSQNLKDKTDCGSGRVYLEKKLASDFYKEEFVIKRENELKKKSQTTSKAKVLPQKPLAQNKTAPKVTLPKKPLAQNKTSSKVTTSQKPLASNKTTAVKKPVKPGAEGELIGKTDRKNTPAPPTVALPPKDETVKPPKPIEKTLPKPEVIRNRDNELVKKIYTSAKELKIDLYDNGEIDGDSISVYDNNKLIISNKGLTDKPITFNIKINENVPVHEFVMVAENLGSIPPNTALMIINAGGKRYELFLTSTEQKNAVVVVEYKPDAKQP